MIETQREKELLKEALGALYDLEDERCYEEPNVSKAIELLQEIEPKQ